jgi:hypothetical protein
MKSLVLLFASGLVVACAGTPTAGSPPTATNPQTSQPITAANSKLSPEKIAYLQRNGYQLVNRDGEPVYCRTEKKLGSHLARETICMTEHEIETLRDTTQHGLDEMSRVRPMTSK